MADLLHTMKHYGLYDYDISTIKRMGHYARITNLKACRHAGLLVERKMSKKGTVNTNKLDNNIARSRTKVNEYALCND